MASVGVDARELSEQPAGKGNYLSTLLVAMLLEAKSASHTWTLYFREGQAAPDIVAMLVAKSGCDPKCISYVHVQGKGMFWHKNVARKAKGHDVFFAALSYFSAIYNTVPTITVVHDLAVFRLKHLVHNKKARFVERLLLNRMVRKSVAIIAVSHATAADLAEYAPQSKGKVAVIPLAPAIHDSSRKVLPLSKRAQEILFVGTLEPRKNILTILKGYAGLSAELRDQYPLVLIGKKGWGDESYEQVVHNLGITKTVTFLGYQSEQVIIDHFYRARLFIYPSLYEGFGLPVVEAMVAGTPVITSTTPALVEVTGSAAIHIDPSDIKRCTESIEQILTRDEVWEKYHREGLIQAQKFSWQKTALQTLELIQVTTKRS